ncbi:poly-gamma-glutamate biosynthesis protein PgsC [Myxococcota bacterium]|nr:poly-gamma-glutamate biosynthesis protein PgsC [Myxococcota bacterium]MBU1431365.1 poly-gamma-glutamate biosynthesis protein PgsC [Myxococcota bacterium]MBU1898388.1 poly-gamma-glutamate biosynthesis protein PgsC [Myxococcota bacterium]
MEQLLPLSVGVGLVTSLLFTELFGLAAGGMVVPGYFALYLNRPEEVIFTLLAGVLTYAITNALSAVVILYGRRRTALTILIGYLLGMGFRALPVSALGMETDVIGYIIPGLIALWIARQGIIETVTSILTVSVVVRLALIVIVGEELLL